MSGWNYILDGHKPVPCPDIVKWGRWFENADRQVAATDVGDITVSTVFLALDHNFTSNGPPVLFETMVFGGKFDGETLRCSTWEQAEKQHQQVVALVIDNAPPTAKDDGKKVRKLKL